LAAPSLRATARELAQQIASCSGCSARQSFHSVANSEGIRDDARGIGEEVGMAEGLLGGVLGGQDEKLEVEAPEALAGADGFAAAVAARLSASDPEAARDTSTFLKKQAQLLETQRKTLGKYDEALKYAPNWAALKEAREALAKQAR
jgi:hypothetical protein